MTLALNFSSIHELKSGKSLAFDADGLPVLASGNRETHTAILVKCYYHERAAFISLPGARACAAERTGHLIANRPYIDAHEIFQLTPDADGGFVVKSAHDRYVRLRADGTFDAGAENIAAAARFGAGEPLSDPATIGTLLNVNRISNLIKYSPAFAEREIARFVTAVADKVRSKQPTIVLIGPGKDVREDGLHITTDISQELVTTGWLSNNVERFFTFNADRSWGIPDSCVDFIYHEDVLEHIGQKAQIKLLAEAFRVLRKGGIHRVNTPCLREAMRVHSRFELGASGVYEQEWDRWGHILLVTHDTMKEYASMIGYSRCFPAMKGFSLSPHFRGDTRPSVDRNAAFGNVIVELIK